MNPLYHKLVFALAVLDDDKDSLLILCDILEQNGEMALAQWGRAKKRNWQKRMDFCFGSRTSQHHLVFNLRFSGGKSSTLGPT